MLGPMKRDIRTSIYKVDLFDPANSSAYSIDTFYHYSDELTEYPPDVLELELNALLMEQYLSRGDGNNYYRATREGKIARQKHFAKLDILSEPLANQRSYALEDLILAILASNRVDSFSGSDYISLEMLSIYLHEFPDDILKDAKAELELTGFIREYNLFTSKYLHITGKGFHKYKTDSRFKLNLGEFEGILRLIEFVKIDARFSKLEFDIDLQKKPRAALV